LDAGSPDLRRIPSFALQAFAAAVSLHDFGAFWLVSTGFGLQSSG